MKAFADFLKTGKTMLQNGGTGTELIRRGGDTPGGVSVITHPDMVEEIHREYVDVGAEILLTCTFSMTEPYAKSHAPNIDWRKSNADAVVLARNAAQDKAYVLANLGPIGQLMEPMGDLTETAAVEAFEAQTRILAGGDIDGFSVQTFYDINEMKCAIQGIRNVSDLPIICSMVIEPNGRTFMGYSLEQAYEMLMPLGIQCIGHNCGNIDAFTLGDILAPLVKAFDIPLMACPNAGIPQIKDGEPIYHMTPEEFAKGACYLEEKGVKLIGGCCGVNRDHIKAAKETLKNL